MKMNGKTLYYHYNAHGDVVALTDAASKVVAEYAYDAWGNVLKSEAVTEEAKTNPYGYAGYTYDKEIEQYYLMARYYDPEQGVFTAIDPDPGDEDDPQTMNGYNYANNNPVMYFDPDGNWAWLIPVVIGAGKIVYKFRKPIAKYGKKGAKWVGKTAKKGGKWIGKQAKKGAKWARSRYDSKKKELKISKNWIVGLPNKKQGGRIFNIVNRKRGRLFALDYAKVGGNKKKYLHFHWNYKSKHHIIYPRKGRRK
ncbi:RHS repeat-associated core domain-containing protein [Listeria ivanovii]|nr:RHS repeat-associated core domain-containing protein [Listeria ivanovii]